MLTHLTPGCRCSARKLPSLLAILLFASCSTSGPPHNAPVRPRASASSGASDLAPRTKGAAAHPSSEARKKELRKVVDDNVGHAHLQRGMNAFTIAALKKATTTADLPVLEELLFDSDRVVAMTAAEVLMTLGDDGRAALERAKAAAERAHSIELTMLLDERLRELARTPAPSLAPAEH